MSGNGDKELHGKLDAWLALWPIEPSAKNDSERAVDLIQARIESLPIGRGPDNWFDDPFPAEPGERKPGEMTMSDDKELEKPKRSSFKDIAQRVSSVPAMPVSDRNPSKPPPGETSGLKRSLSRPPEARDSDSGMVDLNAVREKAASMPEVASVPGTSSIFEDDKDAQKPEKAVAAPKTAKPPEKKSSAIPLIGGLSVAALAVAAAFVLVNRGGMRADQAPASAVAVNAPAASAAPVAQNNPAEAREAPAATAAGLPDNKGDSVEAAHAKVGGPLPAKPGAADDPADKGASAKAAASAAPPGAPAAGAPPTDLGSAMAGAVGTGPDKAPAAADKAAAGPAAGTIPESPSQGAIQGALGAVMGGARACVSGMDEASKANVTFSNDGKVSGVSVSGPAASKPAGGCIKAALMKARVGPFTRPSYSVGVTVRP